MTTAVVEKAADTMLRVIVQRAALVEALALLRLVTTNRTPKPVLACVLLVAEERELVLRATNLSVHIERRVAEVQVESLGTVAVNCAALHERVAALSDDTVTLRPAADRDYLETAGSDAVFKLPTLDPADFPPCGAVEDGKTVEIGGAELLSMLNRTAFAAAKENTRYTCAGVNLEGRKGGVRAVATEGHVLSMADGDGRGDGFKFLVPNDALPILRKMVADESIIMAEASEKLGAFSCDSTRVTVVPLEGIFPPYMDIIPSEVEGEVKADRDALVLALRKASISAEENDPCMVVKLSREGMTLRSASEFGGEAVVKFPCKYDGKEIEIGLKPQWAIQVVAACPGEEVTLGFNGPRRPVKVTGRNYVGIIAPKNIQA